ncbi:MAG: radical SAM family heme chaperone HemW [Bacteroidetes bacterium]|nr:radical SAM family heme chaperone HemW [Bacteroidota bacterium]
MPGIYIHIPFCKQSCHYCDFHFSTTFKGYRERMLAAISKEIELQKEFFNDPIHTIYFGGGTPSLLSGEELTSILNTIHRFFDTSQIQEITLEANPDDLNIEQIRALRSAGINRLSIGIQSFFAEDLRYMNRAHNAQQALDCVALARAEGIDNISIDLIYGFPGLTEEKWQFNLKKAIELGVQHISSYSMTVEAGTALSHQIAKGKALKIDDEQSIQHFKMLQDALKSAGYIHYEISNFSLPAHESKHNSSYWKGKKYLGIGPSAHSFDGANRYWNVANNLRYMDSIEKSVVPFEKEEISADTAYNEYVLTRLRTIWGVEEQDLLTFGANCRDTFHKEIQTYLEHGKVLFFDGKYTLSEEGKFIADKITSDLFMLKE